MTDSTHAWREDFKRSLGRRFLLRVHMSLIVLGVIFTGLLTSVLLHGVGLHHMGARYPIAVVAAYLAFFILIRVWLIYLTRNAEPAPLPDAPHPGYGPPARPRKRSKSRGSDSDSSYDDIHGTRYRVASSSGGSTSSSGDAGSDDGAAVIIAIVVLVAAVLILFGTAIYFVWEAPVILGEAAVELVLAASLASSARRIDSPGWSGSIFKASWKPVLAILVLMTIGGFAAQAACPGATTVRDVIEYVRANHL